MLAALPEEQSRTLRQRYYEGHTLEEIATMEGVSCKAVQRHQNDDLRALRRDWRKLAQFVETRTPITKTTAPALGSGRRR